MFHRHKHAPATPATTTGFVAAPGIVPVAPAPPGPILAVPLVPLQQQQQQPPAAQEPSGGGVLHKMKEGISHLATEKGATETTAQTQPVNPSVYMAPVAPPLQTTMAKEVPTNFLKEERPPVIKEKILSIEEESIQPVIHREVEKREIHEVLQPIHERQVLAPTFEEKQLQAEYRPVIGGYAPRQAPIIAPSVEYASPERTQIVRQPIIEETIKKTIIEEVQPVIHREVVKPHIIRQTQPIYEKILEPEVVLKETRPMIETSESFTGFQVQPEKLPATTTFENKYVFEIDQKTKLKPLGTTSSGLESGYQFQSAYKGYPGAK